MRGIDKFESSLFFYEYEMNAIVKHILLCHDLTLRKYEFEFIENNENIIRNRLYKDFLNSSTLKSKSNLFPCRFECECAEVGSNYREVGYTDIKVFTSISLVEENAYYIFECKRLDGSKSLNKKYITEGIQRFIDFDKYSCFSGINGMIGFVIVTEKMKKNIMEINSTLKLKYSNSCLKLLTLHQEGTKYSVYTSHHIKDEGTQLSLYHVMLDYSSIIKDEN